MPLTNARLLFVDDDPSAIHAMRMLLSDYPNPRFATSGDEALRLARAQRPDLIVLDADMPGMSGLDVLEALQADPALRDIPVMLATAQNDVSLELAALQHGAVDFVSKPLAPLQFRARVHAHLQARAGPLPSSALAIRDTVTAASPRAGMATLLAVDDDVSAVHLLRDTLADTGIVYFATTGKDALELASSVRPDLILLDAHMPGLDGYQVCAQLKADACLSRIPVVFVSRYDDAVNETRALELGAADFIRKPFSAAVLQARVRNLLDLKHRMDAELAAAGQQWRELADARVADIVNSASDAILTCSEHHRVLLANTAACQLFGLPLHAIVGQPLDALVPNPAEWLEQLPQACVQTRVRRPDGREVPVEVAISHLDDSAMRLSTWILRDLSHRDALEKATRARDSAEADSAAKTKMMAWIAHEMGNPLNAICGFAQLMRSDLEQSDTSGRSSVFLDHLETGALRLQQLLGDLLTMAQSDSDRLDIHLSSLDAHTSLSSAKAAVQSQAAQAMVDVRLPMGAANVRVLADERRLHQCLVNLLSNAIKYNHPQGSVELQLSVDGGQVHLDVCDSGQGMTAEQLKQLFQPFNRLGRERQRTPGTGLGLVITQQLVHAMGGSLHVKSSTHQGSCFTITLPCAAAPVSP